MIKMLSMRNNDFFIALMFIRKRLLCINTEQEKLLTGYLPNPNQQITNL